MWPKFDPKLPMLRYTAMVVAIYLIAHGVVTNHSRLVLFFDRWILFILGAMLLMAVIGDWLGQRRVKPEQYHLGGVR
jgi:hypothetical protein